MSDQIKLSVKDFRAIKEADIKLNGITVVSGVNGCGKSTLSKFLYYTFKFANDHDNIVLARLRQSLSDIFHFISILEREILALNGNKTISFDLKKSRLIRSSLIRLEQKDELISIIKSLSENYTNLMDRKIFKDENSVRLINVLKNTLNSSNVDTATFEDMMDKLYSEIKMRFKDAERLVDLRPSKLLRERLGTPFVEFNLPNDYEISEYDVPIISNNSNSVPLIHSVQNISYIDTPMMIGVNMISSIDYWDDLNLELRKKNSNLSFAHEQISDILRNDILKGESDYVDNQNTIQGESFLFKQDDGSVFNLLECATGVKSFSILQLLLKNGFLTKNTLLIIDEPEAHLHPQWIVEYARMIVLLNKEIGVKFFIASHSPDMVSAIKYISEKEQTTQNLEYYLAEQTKDNQYLFSYKSLGTNIDPIFESFNIALDRINQYGISNESNDLF
jgi:predicted ATPase